MKNPLDLTAKDVAPAFPGAPRKNIETHLPVVLNALADAQLTSARLVAYALGTIAAETAAFAPVTEGREDLGNAHPGDGAKFPGRGFVQLTGRDNYRRYGERIGVDLVAHPERAQEPVVAAQLLALFIADRAEAIEKALKAADFARARRLVNGGRHGLERFTTAYNVIFGVLRRAGA